MSGAPIASAGPFVGVRNVWDAPYQDAQTHLLTALNGYFRDPGAQSSWLARPGMTNTNPSAQIGGGTRTQGSHAHVDPTTGTIYRFFVVNGLLYRSNSTFTAFTNVSPVGITIDTANTSRVSFLSVGSALVVTDGVNRPWVMSNFGGTPVTGAYIDIDGAGGSWTAFGPPTIYQDSVFFIALTVPGGSNVIPRIGIVWSEPNQPAVGYTQTAAGYDDRWNLIETGSDPLYAILGTNNGLFYWRQNAIGVLAGTPSINFSTTATRDARGTSIGTISPWTVALYQENIFFVDASLRPWMMPITGEPQPIWQQLTSLIGNMTAKTPSELTAYAVGCVVPELNQYVVAFNVNPSGTNKSPLEASAFDGATGNYGGEWLVSVRIGMDTIVVQRDSNGVPFLCVCGGLNVLGGSGGYVWKLNPLSAGIWVDDGAFVGPSLRTRQMGYSDDRLLLPDSVNVITRTVDPITVAADTAFGASSTMSVTPVASSWPPALAQEYRATVGLDGIGVRSVAFDITGPAAPTGQWGVQRVDVFGSLARASTDDP